MELHSNYRNLILTLQNQTVPQNAFLRELVQNSFEAGADKVAIDIHWPYLERTFDNGKPIYRLAIVDNGQGMDAQELREHLNMLGNSGKSMGLQANFGQGARVTTLFDNPAGVQYFSWKNGICNTARIVWSGDDVGMMYLNSDDYIANLGEGSEWNAWTDIIQEHGTVVVLFGKDENDNTFVRSPKTWAVKYLQTRYYRIPNNSELKVRLLTSDKPEGWPTSRDHASDTKEFHNQNKNIFGDHHDIERMAEAFGSMRIMEADLHWFILNEREVARKINNYALNKAHVAVVYKNELYELNVQKANRAKQEVFGITAGYKRFVIILEPDNGTVQPDQTRMRLLKDRDELPWQEWADEFRTLMPQKVREFIDEERERLFKSNRNERNQLLENLMRKFGTASYRPDRNGTTKATSEIKSVDYEEGSGSKNGNDSSENRSRLLTVESDFGQSARPRSMHRGDIPNVQWLTEAAREEGEYDLDGSVAHYNATDNEIYADENHAVLEMHERVLIEELTPVCANASALENAAHEAVKFGATMCLQQKVMSTKRIFTLKSGSPWTDRDLDEELSDRALTAALGNVVYFYGDVKKLVLDVYKQLERDSDDDITSEIEQVHPLVLK